MKKIDTFYMSEKQIEQMKRKRKFNKKIAISAVLYLVSVATFLVLPKMSPVLANMGYSVVDIETIKSIFEILGGTSAIAGVMTFAKSLHDPLTEKEAQELAEKDDIEKGGFSK